jgi:uncharacterized protein (TIGR02145 family)
MSRTSQICLALAMVSVLVSGCRKDQDPTGLPSPGQNGLFGSSRVLDVGGRVIDEQGLPVQGATVVAGFGAQVTQTDENGMFQLVNISGYQTLGYVKVSKPGYVAGSRSFTPVPGLNNVRIMLLASVPAGMVDASLGGTITSEGMEVQLPADAYLRNGVPYAGNVRVALNHIDPSSDALLEQMPGALLGTTGGTPRLLRSFGMVAVELLDDSGAEVEIAPGEFATLKFPIPASMQAEAPQMIDLWHFDEAGGIWLKDGEAQLQGTDYVAQVGHFSWWNCDIPNSFVQLTGRAVNANNTPLAGARVVVESQFMGTGVTYTNSNGYFGGMVPNNQSLSISVSITCGTDQLEQIYVETLAGLDQDHVMELTLGTGEMTVVQGTVVDCADQPVSAGYVMVGPSAYFCTNGQFTFVTCTGQVEIVGYDQTNYTVGTPQSVQLNVGTHTTGPIPACTDTISSGGVTDIDGYTYQTVLIGDQEWMAENLRVSSYANGDPIPVVHDPAVWAALNTDAVTWWGGGLEEEYGKLYNAYAVQDPRNVCPIGWHAPSDAEWKQLEFTLGVPQLELDVEGQRGGGQNVGGKLKATSTWSTPNIGATNETGFTALPGGIRSITGALSGNYYFGRFWTSTPAGPERVWFRGLGDNIGGIYREGTNVLANSRIGMSVRCIRD